jgi:Flp pilus assembly protein TadG
MIGHAARWSHDRGYALTYMAFFITVLLLFSGLAVDAGRAYVVKAQLTKAVDGAALGAARNLNSGSPQQEAERIFKANFPPGFLGTSEVTDPTDNPDFYNLHTDTTTGVNTITVTASATLPTTFMRLANFDDVTVSSSGEATRRMVDLSLVLDVSSSIGSKWGAVRDAARVFIGGFDGASDRLSLTTFGNGATVVRQMPSSRGFDKNDLINAVPQSLPGGSTNMVEGLYRGWDELRSVPAGQQSGLRVIVLFTDGASNGVPGIYPYPPAAPTPTSLTTSKTLRTYDFPKNSPDPDNQTWNSPQIVGLFDSGSGAQNPSHNKTVSWNSTETILQIPNLPATSFHGHHRSSGIPTTFPLMSNEITVNGYSQSAVRGLRDWNPAAERYPAQVHNINNAARNLVEIIANAARNDDDGDYQIRIFTIGMGELVRYMLGTMPEKPEDILMRMANDIRSPDFNDDQLEGRYYFALTGADVGPAFQALQSQIVRLSK